MTKPSTSYLPKSVAPVLALALGLAGQFLFDGTVPTWLFVLMVPVLFAAVFSAVHYAEIIAHRIGQPFGSIVLTLAVTVIEVALIVSVLLSLDSAESAVARDTVFAAIMIVLNGIVGLCLIVGGIRNGAQSFQSHGATATLGVLGTLTVLALILPNYTLAEDGPVYAPGQLIFVTVVSLVLYGLYMYVQTVRHTEDFVDTADLVPHPEPVSGGAFSSALILLPIALLGVILLAEVLSHQVQMAVSRIDLPEAVVGVVIALVVLMPEGMAALKAAKNDRLQTSLNLALGSAVASVSLTIPTVAVLSMVLGETLILGLAAEHIVLLVLSLFIATLTLAAGRTTVLQGGIHLVIFAAFLTMSAIP